MALSLDGSVSNFTTAASLGISLTTTNANDVIVVVALCNGGPVVSVTATGLTFTRRAQNISDVTNIEEWTATSASALSGVTITVTQTSSAMLSLCAFGISGCPSSNYFDTNGVLPVVNGTHDGGGGTISGSTTNANDFLLGMYRQTNISAPTGGSGWTQIAENDGSFLLVEYKIVSSAQTNLAAGAEGIATNADGFSAIWDAYIQASGAQPEPWWILGNQAALVVQ